MSHIRIRVGASLDAGALTIYQPLEKAAERARKSIDRSLNETTKTQAKVTRAAKSEAQKLDDELEAMANKMLKDEQKAQRARTREVQKETRARAKAERDAAREIARTASESGRAVSEGMHLAHGRGIGRSVGRWLGGNGGTIGIGRRAAVGVSRGGALAYGLGGRALSMAGGAVGEYLHGIGLETSIGANAANAQASSYQAQAISSAGFIRGASGQQGIQQDPAKILSEMQTVGNATATSFNEVGDALRQFVAKTGDLETGRASLMALAKLSKATNTNFVEMAEAAAEVSNHLGPVQDKAGAIQAVMRVVAGQGKLGALEIKDFARQMAKIAANAGKFEGGAIANIGELGILAQESKLRGGSASSTQAATAVASFARDLTKPTTLKHWSAAGLNPFADKGKTMLRSPEELVLEAMRFAKGDLSKLSFLFPNAMSGRAVQGFSSIYSETQGSQADKLKAVHEEFERLRRATLTQSEISRAFGAAMGESKSKVQLANNKLEELAGKLNSELLPAVAALTPAFTAMVGPIAGLIEKFGAFLGINPNEDEDARKRRRNSDLVDAARKELDLALTQGPQLVKGEHGAVLKTPTIDAAHLNAVKGYSSELAGEIAAKAGQVGQDQQDLSAAEEANRNAFGTEGAGDAHQNLEDARRKVESDTMTLNALKQEQNKTNQILSDIHTALVSGRVTVTTPTPPVQSDPSGTSGPNSEDPN